MMHRDGSVFSAVTLTDMAKPGFYKDLGCKLSVGMPFKDLATSDSILMRQLPEESDKAGRLALKRIQVGTGLLSAAHALVSIRFTLFV